MAAITPVGPTAIAGSLNRGEYHTISTTVVEASIKKEDYPRFNSKNPNEKLPYQLLVLYQIGLKQPTATILKMLEVAEKAELNSPKSQVAFARMHARSPGKPLAKISPLTLCISLGRSDVALALINHILRMGKLHRDHINSMAALNAVDLAGWSALHHAAVQPDETVYRALIEAGVDQKLRTDQGFTAKKLCKMTHSEVRPHSLEHLYFDFPEGGVQLAAANLPCFEELTGLTSGYRDEVLCPPEALSEIQCGPQPVPDAPSFSRNLYRAWKTNPPRCRVGLNPKLLEAGVRSYSLYAHEPIKAGRSIGPYSGTIVPKEQLSQFITNNPVDLTTIRVSPYLCENIDAKDSGNLSRFASCTWPNAVIIDIPGQPYLRQLITMRDIQEGEEIGWAYGCKAIELTLATPQILLGKEEMEDFFRKAPFEKLLEIEKENMNSARRLFKANNGMKALPPFLNILQSGKLLFPLDHPTALLHLHCQNLVNLREWEAQLPLLNEVGNVESKNLIEIWNSDHMINSWLVRYIIMSVLETERSARADNHLVTEWIADQLEKRSIIDILRGLDQIRKGLQSHPEIIGNLEEWNRFIAGIDCTQGEHPFHHEGFVQTYLYTLSGAVSNTEFPINAELREGATRYLAQKEISRVTPELHSLIMQVILDGMFRRACIGKEKDIEANRWFTEGGQRLNQQANEAIESAQKG